MRYKIVRHKNQNISCLHIQEEAQNSLRMTEKKLFGRDSSMNTDWGQLGLISKEPINRLDLELKAALHDIK
jgi:hypothetical protein